MIQNWNSNSELGQTTEISMTDITCIMAWYYSCKAHWLLLVLQVVIAHTVTCSLTLFNGHKKEILLNSMHSGLSSNYAWEHRQFIDYVLFYYIWTWLHPSQMLCWLKVIAQKEENKNATIVSCSQYNSRSVSMY